MSDCPKCGMRDDDWFLCRKEDCAVKAKPDDARIATLETQLAGVRTELRTARNIISGTHKRPVHHDKCEITHCPICDGGLFQCADCGAAEIETEQRVCTGSALEATPSAPKVTECATEGCEQPAGIHFIRGNVGSHYCIECYKRVQRISVATLSGDAS